jgi:hypothetical protein
MAGIVIPFPGTTHGVSDGTDNPPNDRRAPKERRKAARKPLAGYTLDRILIGALIYRHVVKDEARARRMLKHLNDALRNRWLSIGFPDTAEAELVAKVIGLDDPVAQSRHREYFTILFGRNKQVKDGLRPGGR